MSERNALMDDRVTRVLGSSFAPSPGGEAGCLESDYCFNLQAY